MDKAYDHNSTEDKLYAAWEKSGKMTADNTSTKPPFTIPLPPPNVTGQLHLGHAAMLAIEDILIRYKKMTGHEVCWLPGTDHAAIATENVVLKHLGAKSREDFTREEFLDHCRKFSDEKHDRIVTQMKKMGAWLDWSRESYTLDEARSNAVTSMFEMLYKDGLIERGHRMINWSVGAQSVLSDDEVEHKEVDGHFYHYKYYLEVDGKKSADFIEIATTRPETLFGDTALAIHPEDPRAADLVGKMAYVPFSDRTIPVVADEHADPEFGTGMLKVTPAHDPNDFAIGQRHNLPHIQVIGFDGKMMANEYVPEEFQGMPREKCRKRITKSGDPEVDTYLLHHKPHTHNVGFCYRSDTVVEPMLSPQWFILVEKEFTDRHTGETTTLKKLTQEAVRNKHVKIIPERFEKTYFQWIDNLRDWCISRQIWWGHRIPVWYDENDNIHLPEQKNVIFVRHGQSEANLKKIAGTDSPLTDKGRDQAQKTAENLKGRKITKVLCSELERAKETAEIIAAQFGAEVEVWPDLREADYGTFEGQTVDQNGKLNLENANNAGTGDSYQNLKDRAESVWKKIKAIETAGDVLVVGHNTFTCTLFADYAGTTADQLLAARKKWDMSNAEARELTIYTAPENAENLRQDEDTLDTWFSSALWPMSPLGWPDKKSADFSKFYPSDVLETGWDILFFWVARMLMFGRYATGKYPFHTVYLHGLVCDEHGKKMSKSKGNGIDPIEVIEEVGADAVRLSLVVGTSPGNPIPIGKNKIKGYRNFVNKLWNAGRFVQMQMEDGTAEDLTSKNLAERWILSRLTTVSAEIADHLEKFEISAAGDKLYHFVWDEFCAWFLEAQKVTKNPAFLSAIFREILKLVHPICPFITEALWEELYGDDTVIDQAYPKLDKRDEKAEQYFNLVQTIITDIRRIRTEQKLNPKEKIRGFFVGTLHEEKHALITELAGLSELTVTEKLAEKPEHSVEIVGKDYTILIEIPFDEAAEAERIAKEKASLENKISALEGRLANKKYVENAPEKLVAETKQQLADAKELLAKL